MQGANRERYLNIIIYKGKLPPLAGTKHFSVLFSFHRPCLFHLSMENVRFEPVRNGHQSGYSGADTKNNNIKKRSKEFSWRRNYKKMHQIEKNTWSEKRNYDGKVQNYMCLQIASIKSFAGNKTRLFPSLFVISTRWFLTSAEAFRDDYVAACSTALCSATEKNKMDGCVTVWYPSKITQHSSTADCFKF